jgi:hypothetical protein
MLTLREWLCLFCLLRLYCRVPLGCVLLCDSGMQVHSVPL